MERTTRMMLNNCRFFVVALLVICTSPLAADVVVKDGLRNENVRITGLEDGVLKYLVRRQPNEAPLNRVTEIQFDAYPDYQRGMALMQSNPDRAARQFRNAVGQLKADDAFLKPLFQLRAAEAYNRAGDLAQAVSMWAEAVAADDSEYFLSRAPDRLPTSDAARAAALRTVRQARANAEAEPVQRVLENLAGRLDADDEAEPASQPPRTTPRRTDQADTTPAAEPAGNNKAAGGGFTERATASARAFQVVNMTLVDNLLRAGNYPDALAAIEQWMEETGSPLGELFIRRAQAKAGAGDHFGAALDYLRVPIHFPKHDKVFDATLAASDELIKIQQFAAARQVLQKAGQFAQTRQQQADVASRLRSLPQ